MAERNDGWPRLPASIIAALSEDERMVIQQHEQEMIASSKLQLADICNNCHVRPQFAKTYRVLRRDLRDMLTRMRSNLAKQTQPYSDVVCAALINSTDEIIRHKLDLMARHFHARWGEPIENWAGKEGEIWDRAGCSILLAIAGSALATVALLVRVLLA